ncbi:MAG TPA: glutamine--fructose-6-phosphate transaminase (isomerizing) [Salinivirgaceae bacterium]|nr:glutamine--fructose-6-phosphate transaminase (isomerizing) [Salinivirgaceae bacterium]HQA76110.1 glutamine--fructose-6-phosphate transaminase (isomerizing) [Salinivirgaceae bacterium]
MCGIVGYIGKRQAFPIVINGLKRLEYRGYDSAGIALWNDKPLVYKSKGRVSDLENLVENRNVEANIGFGHTRWATHGEPNDINAHPHVSMNNKFILIHNGIIENYPRLKKRLEDRGYVFKSDTDTEVLVNLIEYVYLKGDVDAETAIRLALNKIIGTYGLVVFCTDEPDKLIAARKSSPLVIGVGSCEYFIASDATPIVEHTNSVIYLNDNDMAVVKYNELQLKTIQNEELTPIIQKLDLDIGDIDKMGFEHFMLKEIFEQPRSIMDTLRGRIAPDNTDIRLGGLFAVMDELVNARRILIIGCGTSWHAGLVGEYLIEELARISVEVEYASEFRYRDPILYPDDVIIAISQSGETADTLAAIRMAKEKGITVLGICNVVGSSISRETHAGVYTHAGPEIGVASTKAFTAQVAVLTMMALIIGHKKKTISTKQFNEMVDELRNVPNIIEEILKGNDLIRKIAEEYKDATNSIYLGRGYLFPIALEGALKLKEISYIHAEGYPAAEMKHGPIALIDENMPVVFIAMKDKSHEKIVSNIQEVKARKGRIIAVINEGDDVIKSLADHVIEIPQTMTFLSPLTTVIPLQLLSYHVATMRGCNVDQPRNLAKSVTVE